MNWKYATEEMPIPEKFEDSKKWYLVFCKDWMGRCFYQIAQFVITEYNFSTLCNEHDYKETKWLMEESSDIEVISWSEIEEPRRQKRVGDAALHGSPQIPRR